MTADSGKNLRGPADAHGIACPRCGCRHFRVIYKRPTLGGERRRKECRHCGRRVTTTEKLRDGGSPFKRPA